MFLHSLKIDNYKNLEKFKLTFDKKINCFIGKNGIGKTNIIDSIYHFGSGKTIRTSRNKKRNKVIEQVKYYANDTKINYPDKDVIPVTITDEGIQVFSKI